LAPGAIAIAMTGSYRRFERIGIAIGLAALVLIPRPC